MAEDPGTDSRSRSYRLPPAAAEALTHITSTAFVAPMARMFAASAHQLPALLDAYRTGGGVSWEQLGDDGRESQADVNRPLFESGLAAALASVSDVHAVLGRDGASVADVGCGFGWSTLAIATAYPAAHVIGFDVDAPSIEAARANAADAGLADRVSFEQLGGEDVPQHGPFEAAFIFEALHDMPYPIPVLDALRRAVVPEGAIVVMDEAVNDAFMPEGDIVDRLMYGYSLFVCLPDSMSAPGSAATGTVMRRPVLERYAEEAGFSGVDVLDVGEFGFFRFYRLRH